MKKKKKILPIISFILISGCGTVPIEAPNISENIIPEISDNTVSDNIEEDSVSEEDDIIIYDINELKTLVDNGYSFTGEIDKDAIIAFLTEKGYEEKIATDTQITYGKNGIFIDFTEFDNDKIAKLIFDSKKAMYEPPNSQCYGGCVDNTIRLVSVTGGDDTVKSRRYEDVFLNGNVILTAYTGVQSNVHMMEDDLLEMFSKETEVK